MTERWLGSTKLPFLQGDTEMYFRGRKYGIAAMEINYMLLNLL